MSGDRKAGSRDLIQDRRYPVYGSEAFGAGSTTKENRQPEVFCGTEPAGYPGHGASN